MSCAGFSKAPTRVEAFRAIALGVPLPFDPVVTRWGTWLRAAFYYAAHFDDVSAVVASFDSSDAASIAICQELFQKPFIKAQLAFIKTHFFIVAETILALEKRGVQLIKSFSHIISLRQTIRDVPSLVHGVVISEKLETVL